MSPTLLYSGPYRFFFNKGFWLLVNGDEYFVAFDDYPPFKQATIEQIFRMNYIEPDQLHWPDLDVDIELNALRHPEHYPLVWRK